MRRQKKNYSATFKTQAVLELLRGDKYTLSTSETLEGD